MFQSHRKKYYQTKAFLQAQQTDCVLLRNKPKKCLNQVQIMWKNNQIMKKQQRVQEPNLRKKIKKQIKSWETNNSFLKIFIQWKMYIKEIPPNADAFFQDYKSICYLSQMHNQKKGLITNSYYFLYLFYNLINQNGGLIQTVSHSNFKNCILKLIKQLNTNQLVLSPEFYFQLYKQFLFDYELIKNKKIFLFPTFDQKCFEMVPIYCMEEYYAKQKSTFFNIVKQNQISILRGFDDVFRINKKIFTRNHINKLVGNQFADIRIQHPKGRGFQMENQKIPRNKIELTKIKEICTLFKITQLRVYFFWSQYRLRKQSNFIDCPIFLSEFQKNIPQQLLYKTDFDLLSYLTKQIPGVTIPQLYLKVKGTWTGGHQQNLALQAVNINHGPGSSQWITVDQQHIQKLRKIINKGKTSLIEYGCDIYSQQGLWYEQPQFFIERGIPVKKIVQQPGDFVILGPGCLHWVRSYGISVQSAWNIMPKTITQLESCFIRYEKNRQINFRINLIPLYSLILRWLIHEYNVDQGLTSFCFRMIQYKFSQEIRLINQIGYKQTVLIQQLQDTVNQINKQQYCEKCFKQIFIHYIFCSNKEIHEYKRLCFDCYNIHQDYCSQEIMIKARFDVNLLVQFKNWYNKYIQTKEFKSQFQPLCCKTYVGKTKCAFNKK